ncbi:MAG: tRNA (adenosine(37)-N6)-dimethylallyltransferase MiaA, partial [Bacteroidales bacterium]|nr:tRNA (adenosine(37)-N6)-dimethylallyltransferase MiaA [Bacteroidales bacterium]
CGGSMMYVDAVVKGIDRMPTISDSTRDYVLRMLADQGLEGVLAQLKILDPDYWELVDHNNTRRVVHGVEICLEAGVPYSTLRTGSIAKRDFDIVKFAIDWPREALFERINRRVEQMMEHGLLHEAEAALTRGPLNSLNTVGYKELRAYFDGEWNLETAVARIQKNTRVYAKKQLTWLKKDPDVVWLNPQNAYTEMLNYIKRFNV